MKILISLFLALNGIAAAGADKYSPINGTRAVPLSMDNACLRTPGVKAYDYWSLSSFYVPQYNDYACSAASVAMALNALLNARRVRGDQDENISQASLLDAVTAIKWKELLSADGFEGRHGVSLAQLGVVSRAALTAYSTSAFSVTVTTVEAKSASGLETFRKALAANEKNPDDIILLHFAQDLVTGAPGGPYPHVSPVGAYDAKTRRVLIFDVDRLWYEPYWVADAQVFDAMELPTKSFGHGGYVLLNIRR